MLLPNIMPVDVWAAHSTFTTCRRLLQQRLRIRIRTVDHRTHDQAWRQAVVENHRTPVFQQVRFRIDFPAWLARLSPKQRKVALLRHVVSWVKWDNAFTVTGSNLTTGRDCGILA